MVEDLPVLISDYRPYPFKIPSIKLDIYIFDGYVQISSLMKVEPVLEVSVPLVLKGIDIEFQSLTHYDMTWRFMISNFILSAFLIKPNLQSM